MPVLALGGLLLIVLSTVAAVGEMVAARRSERPVRVPVVIGAVAVLVVAGVVGTLNGLSLPGAAGTPRRYARYEPEQPFDLLVLVPVVGVCLLVGAGVGAVRAASLGPDAPAPLRRWSRVLAAAGAVLVVAGALLIALR